MIGTGPAPEPPSEAFRNRITRERNLAAQQVVHGATQAKQVTAGVDVDPGALLG